MLQQVESRPPSWPPATPPPESESASTDWTSLPETHVQATWSSAGGSRRGRDYMHARFYSPQMARFFQVDPVGGNPSNPQSWNRYTYTQNNPLRYVDPTGELQAPSEIADDLDDQIDDLELFLSNQLPANATGIVLDTLLGTVVDLSRGLTDVLRLGESTARQSVLEPVHWRRHYLWVTMHYGRRPSLYRLPELRGVPPHGAVPRWCNGRCRVLN